jgi:protein arginine kinase activator
LKRKCDKCDKPATHHSVEIIKGQKIEKHLCDAHAAQEGLAIKAVAHTPINELLTNFVKLHSGMATVTEARCDACGMTFAEFREHSLLGCPHCYTALRVPLMPLLERAQEGATHHIGKAPRRAVAGADRQQQLVQLRKRLTDAVANEDYELAAKLRDEVRRVEEHG